MPCRIDGRDVDAEMTICRRVLSEVLGTDAGLEGGWYLESNKLVFPSSKKVAWILK